MRRKPGVLLPIEIEILEVSAGGRTAGDGWLHGYALAKQMSEERGTKRLTAHGTLYKALGRLADGGLLEHRWEDPDAALEAGRPRRRLYRITGLGRHALADARVPAPARHPSTRPGTTPA